MSDFTSAIDLAIDNSDHMILLASKTDFLQSTWVQSEWKMFESEFRSSNKKGNLILVLKKPFDIKQLPIALRSKQVIEYAKSGFPQILKYLISNQINPKFEKNKNSETPKKTINYNKSLTKGLYLLVTILLLGLVAKIIFKQNIKSKKEEPIPQSISNANQFKNIISTIGNLTNSEQKQVKLLITQFIELNKNSITVKDSISEILETWTPKPENQNFKRELILKLKPLPEKIQKPRPERRKKNKMEHSVSPKNTIKQDEIYYYKDPELKNE